MAEKRILRRIVAVFDRNAARQVEGEMVRSLESAGQKGGDNFLRELRGRFNSRMARLREELASGLIDQTEFKKQADQAARSFNEGLVSAMQNARREGKLTDAEHIKLSRNFKRVGDVGTSAWQRIRQGIIAAGTALAAFFAARRLIQFGRDSIQAFRDLRAEFRLTEQQLKNMGVAWRDVEGEVRAHARALWDTHRLTEGEVVGTFRQLLVVTGDYQKSLRAVGVAHDIMAATGLGAEQASRLLGRAINGELTVFNRYGVALDANRDALEQLEERFRGAALANTDATDTWRKALGDLQETVGGIITMTFGLDEGASALANTIRKLNDALSDNRNEWVRVGRVTNAVLLTISRSAQIAFDVILSAVLGLVTGAVFGLNQLVRAANRALDVLDMIPGVNLEFRVNELPFERGFDALDHRTKRIGEHARVMGDAWRRAGEDIESGAGAAGSAVGSLADETERATSAAAALGGRARDELAVLQDGIRLRILEREEARRIFTLIAETRTELERVNLTLERRVELTQRLATLEAMAADRYVRSRAGEPGAAGLAVPGMAGPEVIQSVRVPEPDRHTLNAWHEALIALADQSRFAAWSMESAFEEFFTAMFTGFDTTRAGFHSLVDAAAGIGGSIVAGLAGGMRNYHFAQATGKLAEGIWPPNPAALTAAAQHMVAAGLFGAIEGLGGGAGRRSAVAGVSSEVGRGPVDRAPGQQTQIINYVQGFDPNDPRHQDLLGQGYSNLGYRDARFRVENRPWDGRRRT